MTTRAIKALFVGSLVLNVFLVGAITGGAYRWFATQRAERAAPQALRYAAQELSPERQRQFLDALKQARRDARAIGQQAREGRREVLRLVAAPQFDRAALDDALATTRHADSALREHIEAAVADFVATLTPAERVTFAQGLTLRGQWRQPKPAAEKKPDEAGSAPPAH
ncbi:periplasmic heavy metal sensor [Trinickia diaoshuihuensis]|uniref:periplasmic heavy metal sensor n=1 Tax=Trinickia diaoshuihuensis TaxID=2292265 RepID=UPI000E23FF96|nr:periplasmic heavy metal sensor [Trinickia diaoshuihuensis]